MKVDFSFACPERWSSMSGGEEARHCASCDKTVHNLSALGPRRSGQLLQSAAAGEVCVTAVHDRDRNVIFDRRLFRMAAATPLLALSTIALADGQIPDLTAVPAETDELTIEVTDEMLEDVEDADCDKPVGPGDYTPDPIEEPVYITAGVYIDPGPPLNQPPPPPPEPEPQPEPAADAETSG